MNASAMKYLGRCGKNNFDGSIQRRSIRRVYGVPVRGLPLREPYPEPERNWHVDI